MHDHQFSDINALGSIIVGVNASINSSLSIATVPTNYAFPSSTTSEEITPHHQRQKNASTHMPNKAQTSHDKHSKTRSKQRLHHSNKITDLEEIASLDGGVSLPPSLSRASSEQSNLNHK